jgi:extracellular factor (EF) 3-hydroxypalmitic acid methyl ester biosynthesis protein
MLALDKPLAVKDSIVTFQTSVGNELRASMLRVDRFEVAFEIYGPPTVLRASEVLSDFRIIVNDRLIYAGRAVVSNLVDAGVALVCQASLDEASWVDVEVVSAASAPAELARGFTTFIEEWQKLYRVRPEYKLIVADMQSFFIQLRLWLDQVELGIRSTPSGDRLKLEQALTEELAEPVIAAMNVLFEKFEAVAKGLDEELEPVHRSYMRQQLHPWVMSAPFPHRTFNKPLGYAGDYEMVNMMLRTVHEGGSLFAKLVNAWFLHQPPAQAHRNRVKYLADKLTQETLRAKSAGREARIFNVACGPAHEIQKFLAEQTLSSNSRFTLLDFNEETLQYARTQLTEISTRHGRGAKLNFVKRSVQAVLKEGGRSVARPAQEQYDVVYCAGLFDYLSDPICQRLLNVMYEWLAPGGVLISTNVDPGNPMRKGMEHLLDWHLIYRTGPRMLAMKPRQAGEDAASVHSDETGVNVFLEVRKPNG